MATAKKPCPGLVIKGLSAFVGLACVVSAARADALVSTVPQTNGSAAAGKQVPGTPATHAAMGTLPDLGKHHSGSAVPLFFPPVQPSPPPTPPTSGSPQHPVISGSNSGPTGQQTPEPATLVGSLVGGGLLALFGWGRLRKNGRLLQPA
jgi:hypothetical protein